MGSREEKQALSLIFTCVCISFKNTDVPCTGKHWVPEEAKENYWAHKYRVISEY